MHQNLHCVYAGIRPVIPGKIEEYITLDLRPNLRPNSPSKDDFLPQAREWKFDTFDFERRDQGLRTYENYSQHICVGVTNNKELFINTMGRTFRKIKNAKLPKGKRGIMYGHKGRKISVIAHLQFLSYTLRRLMKKAHFIPATNLEEYQAGYNHGHHSRRRRRIIPIPPFDEDTITHTIRDRGVKPHSSLRKRNIFRGRRDESEWSFWDPHTNQVIQGDEYLNTQYSFNRSSPYGHSSSHHAPSYSHGQVPRSVSGNPYKHHSPHRASRDYHDHDTRSNISRESGYGSRSFSSGSSSRSSDSRSSSRSSDSSSSSRSSESGSSSRSSNSGRNNHHGGSRAKAAKRHKPGDSAYSSSRYGGSDYGGDGYGSSDYGGDAYSGNSDMNSYLSASSRSPRHNPVYVSPRQQEEIDRLAENGLIPPNEGDRIPSVPYNEFGYPLSAYEVEQRRTNIAASSASGGY